jgi:hypothetical protein
VAYDYELDTAQTFLPASYAIDITATMDGYTSLTRSFVIQVNPALAQDTVRTLSDLLTNIWRDGQGPHELTAQDVRDTIISLALQTADFSRLPTSAAGLATGRVYVDNGVLKVNFNSPAINWLSTATLAGIGGFTPNPRILGPGSAAFSGSGTLGRAATGAFATAFSNAFAIGGVSSGVDATVSGGGSGGAFSSAFSNAFDNS